jgi:hypothetical protein
MFAQTESGIFAQNESGMFAQTESGMFAQTESGMLEPLNSLALISEINSSFLLISMILSELRNLLNRRAGFSLFRLRRCENNAPDPLPAHIEVEAGTRYQSDVLVCAG